MPFIAESDTMDSIKDQKKERKEKKEKKESKKRKSSAITEQPAPAESMDIDTEMTGVDETTVNESKKKRSKKEKKEKKEESVEATEEAETTPTESPEEVTQTNDDKTSEEPPTKKRKSSVDEIEVDITLPEPPSKKALRRLKKGKPLPPSKSGAESSPEPEAKKKAEVEKRSGHGVWIGNLPWSVSKEELRKWIVEFSDLTEENITRVHMPGPNDGKPANQVEKKFGKPVHNKGFAYVDFATEEQVKMAVELSEQLLTGRRLLIKDNKSFEGRPEKKEAVVNGKPPSKKIFVGNLRFDATEEILKEHFEKCGAIEKIHVATFEDSGKCKGYAWVVFEEVSAAQSAVKGWVHIEEELSDEESSSSSDSDSDSEDEATTKAEKPKKTKTKTRKWWVNKIQGRPLRMEFAEDDQLRYKKRYGKDGSKNPNERHPREERESGARVGANDEPVVPRVPGERRERPVKKVEYRQSYAPRLTGGIVESEGKKTTF
ncbi:Nucleolar protein 13 [Ciborinia camelliae]|nr:Nucleolar protein 13 [Ciborinia camelliae]